VFGSSATTIAGSKFGPINDGDRFDMAVRQTVGKRITYKELTGKTADATFQNF
jgi:hypothetical protein